jgi:hypothetical protein
MLAAVGPFLGLGEQPGGQERAKEEVQAREALLAQLLDATPEGAQLGASGREKGGAHIQYLYCIT